MILISPSACPARTLNFLEKGFRAEYFCLMRVSADEIGGRKHRGLTIIHDILKVLGRLPFFRVALRGLKRFSGIAAPLDGKISFLLICVFR
jgi:hypothetical protein